MLREVIVATAEWEWKTRVYVSITFSLVSLSLFLFYDTVWVWGYAVSAFLLIVPFLFREKHVEFDVEKAEELAVIDFSLTDEKLRVLLVFLKSIAEKGFDDTKLSAVLSQVKALGRGREKLFNLYVITNKTKSSLAIYICNDGGQFGKSEEKTVRFTSNNDLRQVLINYMKNYE